MLTKTKRSIIRFAVLMTAVIVAQSAVAADSTILWRSASTGVINQALSPSEPTIPPGQSPVTPTAPSVPSVFKSVGYTGQIIEDWELTTGRMIEVAVPYGSAICDIIDSSPAKKNRMMQTGYYAGQPSGNTPSVSFVPLQAGVFEIVIGCGDNARSLSPVKQYRFDVK